MTEFNTTPFDRIGPSDVLKLLSDGINELKTLDYKRQQVGPKDPDKKEFFADVSSFANASGGDLIFGVEEAEGAPTKIVGLGPIDTDAEILRLENMLRSGIEPRIHGIQTEPIDVPGHGLVMVMRIPRSWASPHMLKESGRFFSRTSRGKYPLDVQEIRSAFLLSENISDRVRKFRMDRIGKIIADETPVPPSSAGS